MEVCIHLAHPFLPDIWRYLIFHDQEEFREPPRVDLSHHEADTPDLLHGGEIICPQEGLIMEANYRLKYPYYLVAAWRKFTGMKTMLSPIYLPLLITLK